MARLFSPSGETEFFEITELQAGFEKELKTGERVTVSPGAREASFLREAPIRAELSQLYEQFRERVLNPTDPFQPPVPMFVCATWVNQPNGKFESGNATGVSSAPNPPEIHVTLNQSNSPAVARWANQTAITTGIVSGANFAFPAIDWANIYAIPPNSLSNGTFFGPSSYFGPSNLVPNAFSAEVKVAWWNPIGPNSITNIQLGLIKDTSVVANPGDPITSGDYVSPAISCNNIPANNSAVPMLIAKLAADFSITQYSCGGYLINFNWTNFYP